MKVHYRTKKEMVYYELKNEIIQGEIKAGEKLVISHLAKRLQVSEIPVREALQQLASESYVKFIPHIGNVVNSISEKQFSEIFELRILLESFAVQNAIDHITNAHLKELRKLVLDSKKILKKDGSTDQEIYEQYAKHNRDFHELIYRHSNNQRMYKLIFELWDNSRRYPQLFDSLESVNSSIKEHLEIIESLEKRDKNLTSELMRKHKEKAYNILMQKIKDSNLELEEKEEKDEKIY